MSRGLVVFVLLLAQPRAESFGVHVTLDIAPLASIPQRQADAMKREAEDIWRDHHVALEWTTDPSAFALPNAPLTLTISRGSLPRAPGAADGPRLGGAVFLDGQVFAEDRLVVSVESVTALVEETRWRGRPVREWPPALRQELVGRALGRVVAHELGHYLLAWRRHSARGLMRETLAGATLISPDRRLVAISDELLPRLRVRLSQLADPNLLVTQHGAAAPDDAGPE